MSLSDVFAAARAESRAALIGYLPAGFPTVEGSKDYLRSMVESGCDLVEVGLPFSDPVMDGPTIQAAAAHMVDGGRIITIGSNTAVRSGVVGSSVYAMTKAAVATLVRELALDLAPRRITINNIQPGPIETDITSGFLDALIERNPLRRVGRPVEVAALAAHLASADAGYMTGASLTLDGGFSI